MIQSIVEWIKGLVHFVVVHWLNKTSRNTLLKKSFSNNFRERQDSNPGPDPIKKFQRKSTLDFATPKIL